MTSLESEMTSPIDKGQEGLARPKGPETESFGNVVDQEIDRLTDELERFSREEVVTPVNRDKAMQLVGEFKTKLRQLGHLPDIEIENKMIADLMAQLPDLSGSDWPLRLKYGLLDALRRARSRLIYG